jgi:periodic tryptophan protein 1
MISCVEWVPKGVADPNPKAYELSATERKLLETQAEPEAALESDDDEEEDEEREVESSKIQLPKIDPKSLPPELRMDEYSSDEEENEAKEGSAIGKLLVGNDSDEDFMAVEEANDEDEEQLNGQDLSNDAVNSDDSDDDSDDDLADVPDTREFIPTDLEGLEAMGLSHVGAGGAMNLDGMGDQDDEDDDSDIDDINLAPDDAVVVVAKTEDDFASLEVLVYEPTSGNLFVHHDIVLPSFPLCLAHGDINCDGDAGNFCAVGTFSPGIEVWNLDVLNPLEPSCILGGEDTSAADELMKKNMARAASGKKLKKKHLVGGGLRPGSHTDAVMALSWNKVHRQVLASGSADCTVKLWDITKAGEGGGKANAATFTHHRDKVQSVQWHPTEGTLLATGSYDRTVSLVDARSADQNFKRVKISADCESISWDPFNSQYLTVAAEDGTISCWDVRKFETGSPVWSFVASEYGGVSDLSFNQ